MQRDLLQHSLNRIKDEFEQAVRFASYRGQIYQNGLEAKNALIRSQNLIQFLHEAVKISLHFELVAKEQAHEIYPPLGQTGPEIDVWGLLKKKKQDIVVAIGDLPAQPEIINEGPMAGQIDGLGLTRTGKSIVVGVRSQLSSVDKNFDTLMERTFAETLNLRLRHPALVMGEVYLLAVREYDDQLMKQNVVGWKGRALKVERFISLFLGISGRINAAEVKEAYKYERSALIFADFSQDPPKIYYTLSELKNAGIVSQNYNGEYALISPDNFARDLVEAYRVRHANAE